MKNPRKLSQRQNLIMQLALSQDMAEMEKTMYLPNPQTIAKYQQKYTDTALTLAKLELAAYRKKLNKVHKLSGSYR